MKVVIMLRTTEYATLTGYRFSWLKPDVACQFVRRTVKDIVYHILDEYTTPTAA